MKYVSNSEIQTFKRCRRKWWLTYWRKLHLIRGKVHKPREVGDLVHKRLDRYYQGGMTDDVLEELKDDIKWMNEHFPDQEKEVKQIGELARIMVEGYFEWIEETGADAHLEVVAPEQNVMAPMPELGVVMLGKLDVRVNNMQTGGRQFLETKTTGSFADLIKTADSNEQLLEYHLLEQMTGDDETRSDGSILNMLKRVKRTKAAKPPFFMRHPVPHNLDELRTFYLRTYGVITKILDLEHDLGEGGDPMIHAYPSPKRDCTWDCDFFSICSMMNDPNKQAEEMISISYEEHDPNARYSDLTGKESEE